MSKIIYPHRLRAIRIREDMVLITIKNAPDGAWKNILSLVDTGLLLGVPRSGWLRCAIPASRAEAIALPSNNEIIPAVRIVDVYGMDMRGLCTSVLQALEEMGQTVLGISLSTQRMSAVVAGEYPDISDLCSRFPMEL